MTNKQDELNTFSHTTWNYKYHVVFAPKYRRKVFYDAKQSTSYISFNATIKS